VKGSKVAQRLMNEGIKAAGVWYHSSTLVLTVEASCAGNGAILRASAATCQCVATAQAHTVPETTSAMAGCNAKQDTLCGHTGTQEKCHNCKGNHIAFSSRCAKMTEAAKVVCHRRLMGPAWGATASEVTAAAMGANRVAPVIHFV
jgi:hypothetical protein